MIGVSAHGPIGVDLEIVRPLEDAALLAEECFTEQERRDWAESGPESSDQAFLWRWTRKEACVKALGLGLSLPLGSFSAGGRAGPSHVTVPTPSGSRELTLLSVETPGQSVAAVSVCSSCSDSRARVEVEVEALRERLERRIQDLMGDQS